MQRNILEDTNLKLKIADDKNAQTIIGTMSVAGKKELKTLQIS